MEILEHKRLLKLYKKYHKYWNSLMYNKWGADIYEKYDNDFEKIQTRMNFIETQSFRYAIKIADCNKNKVEIHEQKHIKVTVISINREPKSVIEKDGKWDIVNDETKEVIDTCRDMAGAYFLMNKIEADRVEKIRNEFIK